MKTPHATLQDLLDRVKQIAPEYFNPGEPETLIEVIEEVLNDMDIVECCRCSALGPWGREENAYCDACQVEWEGEEMAEETASFRSGEIYAGNGHYSYRRIA